MFGNYTVSSLLRMVQTRFILKRCLFLLLRYLSLMILKVLIFALMFSITIRSCDNSRLNNFCSLVNGWSLLLLYGIRLFLCKANNPWQPLSASSIIPKIIARTAFLNIRKSWTVSISWAVQRISCVCTSAMICVFIVCRFFLPEYHSFCFFRTFNRTFRHIDDQRPASIFFGQ